MDLSPRLEALLPTGWDNARSAAALSDALGCSQRKVGELAASLVDRGVLVGSTCNAGHHGYFLIDNEEDLEVGTQHIRSRAIASLVRIRNLRTAAAQRFGEGKALRLFDLALLDLEEVGS